MLKLIDISVHNWNAPIDFKKVKASGIDGVIIRAGYGRVISQKDKQFEAAYAGAKAAGLHVGAYWYSYADTPADAITEANTCLQAIAGKTFELPVYFDMEEQKQVSMGKATCTKMCQNFCDTLESKGYFAGIYSFDSFFGSNLDAGVTSKYTAWVARVENVKPKICSDYGIWQYSWKGVVNGIKGDVDMNECYKDFPSVIKSVGLNGYSKSTPSAKSDEYTVIAEIRGCSQSEANAIKSACIKQGMDVSISKE